MLVYMASAWHRTCSPTCWRNCQSWSSCRKNSWLSELAGDEDDWLASAVTGVWLRGEPRFLNKGGDLVTSSRGSPDLLDWLSILWVTASCFLGGRAAR